MIHKLQHTSGKKRCRKERNLCNSGANKCLLKLKICIPFDPDSPLPGVHPREALALCIKMHFKHVSCSWKILYIYPSIGRWLDKLQNFHSIENYVAMKRHEVGQTCVEECQKWKMKSQKRKASKKKSTSPSPASPATTANPGQNKVYLACLCFKIQTRPKTQRKTMFLYMYINAWNSLEGNKKMVQCGYSG